MLVAEDGQHPAASSFTMYSLGFPGTVRLLGGRLMLRGCALVRPAAAIADEIASNYLVAGQISSPNTTPMRSGLDDLVAILLHTLMQLGKQIIERAEKACWGRHCYRREDAEHGGY